MRLRLRLRLELGLVRSRFLSEVKRRRRYVQGCMILYNDVSTLHLPYEGLY